MTTLHERTRQLTEPWNEILTPDTTGDGYVVIDHEPRLNMLRGMIGSNSGGTTAGGSLASTRNLVNVPALDLWQRIDEQTRASLEQHGTRPKRELIEAVDQLGQVADTLRNTNAMTEQEHSRLIRRVEGWRAQIENLYDPPTRKEIRGTCPNCGTDRVQTPNGETTAIYAYYWRGQEPAAECQACPKTWQGERALLELGFSIHANVDHDELRAMGVM